MRRRASQTCYNAKRGHTSAISAPASVATIGVCVRRRAGVAAAIVARAAPFLPSSLCLVFEICECLRFSLMV